MSKCRHDWVPYDTSYKAGGWEGQICTKCGEEEVAPDERDSIIVDLRAQLAQREAEIEALRALLQDAVEAIEAEGLDTEYFERRWLYLYPESPALTDKEA